MKLGFDVDGVLCDFNTTYIARIKDVTGRDLFPEGYVPDTYYFPEKLKYTGDELTAVWASINTDPTFWRTLQPYPHTHHLISILTRRIWEGDEIYFITARPSPTAKFQTESWLSACGMCSPTVLMSRHKGLACAALELDVYLDDCHKNALSVAQSTTRSFLFDRPWNRRHEAQDDGHRIIRVPSIDAFFERLTWFSK